jgi:hypothetical protein
LIRDLMDAGFYEIPGGERVLTGSIRTRAMPAVTLSGALGEDAKHYQEKQIRRAVEKVQQ